MRVLEGSENPHKNHHQWPRGSRAQATKSWGGHARTWNQIACNRTRIRTDPRPEVHWSPTPTRTVPAQRIDRTSARRRPTTRRNSSRPSGLCASRHLIPRSTSDPPKPQRRNPGAARRPPPDCRAFLGLSAPGRVTQPVLQPAHLLKRETLVTPRWSWRPAPGVSRPVDGGQHNRRPVQGLRGHGKHQTPSHSSPSSIWAGILQTGPPPGAGTGLKPRATQGNRPHSKLRNQTFLAPQDAGVTAAKTMPDETPEGANSRTS